MPIPFIIIPAAVALGGYGIKKGLDAKDMLKEAKRINEEAEKLVESTKTEIQNANDSARDAIDFLNGMKISVMSTTMKDFAELYSQIGNIDFRSVPGCEEFEDFTPDSPEFQEMKAASFEAAEIAQGATGGAAAGALAAAGTYGAVGVLGTASTGAAISGLSGAAATNATLAWLGGGSLASGGLGMAGGMAVLGGVVVAPALAIGGLFMESEAKTALNNAKSNMDKARGFEQTGKNIVTVCQAVEDRAWQIEDLIRKLNDYLKIAVENLKIVISVAGTDFSRYNENAKNALMLARQLAQTTKIVIMNTGIEECTALKDDGTLNSEELDSYEYQTSSTVDKNRAVIDACEGIAVVEDGSIYKNETALTTVANAVGGLVSSNEVQGYAKSLITNKTVQDTAVKATKGAFAVAAKSAKSIKDATKNIKGKDAALAVAAIAVVAAGVKIATDEELRNNIKNTAKSIGSKVSETAGSVFGKFKGFFGKSSKTETTRELEELPPGIVAPNETITIDAEIIDAEIIESPPVKSKKVVSLKKGQKISLKKGQKVSLTKGNSGLKKILIGLGWDINKYDGDFDFDLDAAAFLLGKNEKVTSDEDFVFYNNLKHASGSVEHLGDNLTGEGEGDDEQIKIDLEKVPAEIKKIAFTVTIHDAETRDQNFGQISNAYIRIVDDVTQQELIRYDLGEDFSVETAIVVGEIYRYKKEWKFNAIGSGFEGGLAALCQNYGVDIG